MLRTVKGRELYEGLENFLYFVLEPTIKKRRGVVTESMGSFMDSECDKRRRLIIKEIGKESVMHLNCPQCLFSIIWESNPYSFLGVAPGVWYNRKQEPFESTVLKSALE